MCDRHPKWVRVESGHVIPAGQPYRIEFNDGCAGSRMPWASEFLSGEPFQTGPKYAYFVDSLWVPPLVLPTEPTWGIVLNKRPDRKDGHALDFGRWAVYGDDEFAPLERTHRSEFDTRCDVLSRDGIADFIELTPEQVQRIEAAQ